jgi:hypothetical protein
MNGRLPLGMLLAAGLVAGCGGGHSPGVASLGSTHDSPTPSAASAQAFSQCMRSHGIRDFPDPNAQGQIQLQAGPNSDLGPDNPTFQAAQRACQSLFPGKTMSPAQQAQALARALRFSRCMRSHGIADFPDPSAQGGALRLSIHGGPGGDLNPNNPQFQAAQKACGSLLPGRPGSGQLLQKTGPGGSTSDGGTGAVIG